MAEYTITPGGAGEDAWSHQDLDALAGGYPPKLEDPVAYTTYEQRRMSVKFIGEPVIENLLALVKSRVQSKTYFKVYTCVSGLNVGDPVYISANNTATLALATTAATSRVVGFCRYKPTTTTCYIDHFRVVTGLSGLTANAAVFLTDAGGFSATAGTVRKVVGWAYNTTEAILFGGPIPNHGDDHGPGGSDPIESTTENLCLNPGFETVLPGTHTTAITQNPAAGDKNLVFPGWKSNATVLGNITCTQETTEVSARSKSSLEVAVTNAGSNPKIFQRWDAGEYLDHMVYGVQGKVLTFECDVKLDTGTASAVRAWITTDGTGGTTTYSSYKANDTSWERLHVSVTVPTDATDIEFGVVFENASVVTVYIDNCMVVAADSEVFSVPYKIRNPISISKFVDLANVLDYTTPADTNWHVSNDGTADTDYNFNSRPAWAIGFHGMLQASGAAVSDFGEVRPNGATNYSGLVSGVSNSFNAYKQYLGANSQIQFSVTDANVDISIYINSWFGEGL